MSYIFSKILAVVFILITNNILYSIYQNTVGPFNLQGLDSQPPNANYKILQMNATANLTPYDLPQAKLLVLMNFLYVCDDENSLEQTRK